MTQLFDRKCVLLVGGDPPAGDFSLQQPNAIRIDGLRVVFKIEKDDTAQPNKAEVVVYNLADQSRSRFESKNARCVLSAGYQNETAQIASFDISYCQHQKTGVDWVTKIQGGDGERAITHARVSTSYRPGAKKADVIGDVVRALGLDGVGALNIARSIVGEFSSGYSSFGKASTELSKVLPKTHTWSVQDGRIEIRNIEDTAIQSALISPDTGLVGAPEMGTPDKKNGRSTLKVRSLLQPNIKPGQRFELRSRGISGVFTAKKVTHTGDTFGADWYTDIEAQ